MRRTRIGLPALALVAFLSPRGLAAPRQPGDTQNVQPTNAASQPKDDAPPNGSNPARKSDGYGKPYDSGADRAKLPDLYKYYGPNGLWARWNESQKLGRDTWIMYTGGNQKFYRILARFGGQLGISVDFYRVLDSRRRDQRFRELGLINEPNLVGGQKDEFGFWIDQRPEGFQDPSYPKDDRWYGTPTGIIGLRLFPNPKFSEAMRADWMKDPEASVRRYFDNPGGVEPPRIVGITCALCHIAFDPLNPPADPANPRWENLAANIGNQYFREGDLFFGAGRVVGGNANPGPNFASDPYDTGGLDERSFLYQYGHTQEPGTSETSRFSYDFINNPNTINQIFYLGNRAQFCETTPTGVKLLTNHILKDGADSTGIHNALLRVYINIGSEGDYWADRLWNPLTGTPQSPFQLKEVKLQVDDAHRRELLEKYPDLGEAWREQERRAPFLASYLASYTPFYLKEIKDEHGQPKYVSHDPEQLRRGAILFADNCARCHSNKQPFYPLSSQEEKTRFYRELVLSDDFLNGNTLADDVRHPFDEPGFGVNAARALATNAIDGDIWADFSSEEYKALPSRRSLTFSNPLQLVSPRYGESPIVTRFVAPGGGRGYYRTAALNSLWATAPYLHNNAVGPGPVSLDEHGREFLDARYVGIEGRLELFEKSMQALLSPTSQRTPKIKVTSTDSSLLAGMSGVRERLAVMIRQIAKQRAEEIYRQAIDKVVADLDLPDVDGQLEQSLKTVVADLLLNLGAELEKVYTQESLAKIKEEVASVIQTKLDAIVAEKLQGRPELAALVAKLKPSFEAAIQQHSADLADLFRVDLVIPAKTPINLILNLQVGKAPYALAAFLKLKDQPRRLAEELLKLSDCPDLVENRGHEFGWKLSAQEKRDLIEFLKTF